MIGQPRVESGLGALVAAIAPDGANWMIVPPPTRFTAPLTALPFPVHCTVVPFTVPAFNVSLNPISTTTFVGTPLVPYHGFAFTTTGATVLKSPAAVNDP